MSDSEDAAGTPNLQDLGDLIERLSTVAQRTGLATLKVKTDDFKIELTTGLAKAPRRVEQVAALPAFSSDSVPVVDVATQIDGYIVTSPMVGTFYRSTSPTQPPLVNVGDRIESGQLIGIIEAMKIMNEITSDRGGTVLEVIAGNAEAVEYGSPLIRVGP
ncbi:MAG TPA: acetyl-CoA carboxylase biotin carboxyl carrier protein [Thermomicrobiales bacterium]|nr:acetyl-CoA carboxylase biotin carboxyl carrier protein [Thermomicrobiales bacterium]